MKSALAVSIVLLSVLLCAAGGDDKGLAGKVSVEVALEGVGESQIRAVLRAEPLSGEEGKRDWEISLPWEGTVDLAPGLSWRLLVEAPGHWAAAQTVDSGLPTPAVRFRMIPTGKLSGHLIFPRHKPPPDRLAVQFQATPQGKGRSAPSRIPRTKTSCPLEGDRWVCDVPSGELDLRFEVEGLVPHYAWGIQVKPETTIELGLVRFERGTSVAGWVQTPNDLPGEEQASVVLEPQVLGWHGDPRTGERMDTRSYRATTNDRGFFQVKGLAAGGYVLRASVTGFSPLELLLDAEEEAEVLLREPLILQPPVTLEVFLDPPADPNGLAWMVTLIRRKGMTEVYEKEYASAASLQGYWQSGALDSGQYQITIDDSRGSTWDTQEVEIRQETPTLFVTLPLVPVEGRISLGADPLQAILSFGSTQGSRDIRMDSGEDGRFEGYLPRQGQWKVEVLTGELGITQATEPVEVRKRQGSRAAFLDISLPNTRLTGRVVEDERPAADVAVAIVRAGQKKRREAILRTDEAGEFTLRGLSPGRLFIEAYRGDRTSGWVPATVQEDLEGPPLRLVLRKKHEIAGRILAAGGAVPGVNVSATPLAGPSSILGRAVSRADGTFSLGVPAEMSVVSLVVTPPGFAARVLPLQLSTVEAQPLAIHVERSGGTLVIEVDSSSETGEFDTWSLHHQGAAVSVKLLLSVLHPLARAPFHENGFAFSNMEAGEYALCRARVAAPGSCTSGFLAAGSELSLRFGSSSLLDE